MDKRQTNGTKAATKRAGAKASPAKKAAARKRAGKKAPARRWPGILNSRFYRIYFIVVAAALVFIAVGLIWLNGAARDYEISQPVHVAEEVARYFEEGDFETLYSMDTSAQEISEGDKAFYIQSMKDLTAGKQVRWSPAFSSNKDEERYTVTLDGGKFATFTLVPSGETTRRGNRLWQLGTVTTHVVTEKAIAAQDPANAAYRVKVPAGYVVTVDGAALDETNVINAAESVLPDGFLPSGVTAPVMTEYGFDSEAATPSIAVTDQSGAAREVAPNGDNAWICPVQENEEAKAKYTDAVVKLAQRIAKYTYKDLSQESLLSAVASDSPAETIIKKFSNYWAQTHKDVVFRNVEVTDFYVLSDDCFTCHVAFDTVLISVRDNEYTYHTEYTFCIIKRRNTGKLYNLVLY